MQGASKFNAKTKINKFYISYPANPLIPKILIQTAKVDVLHLRGVKELLSES